LNGDAIVDCHPEYLTITPQESEDTNNTSTVLKAIFRNFPSRLQERRPVWLENGLGTCFTMIHFQQATSSVIPGETLRIVDFSDDILPIQADFENEEGKGNTCTERDFIKKTSVGQSNHLLLLRKIKIMWLMIDAIDNDFLEFKAMIYGGHPGRYWSGLLEEAHFWAIGHFNSLDRLVNFKLPLLKSPHFCAVIHGYDYSQWLKMESAVAEFVGVDECSYFWETDFPRYGTAEDPLVLALWYNVLVNGQKMNVSSQR
jgi:hypothetical protein